MLQTLRRKAHKINHKPTDAQKSAGNYRKAHVRLHGLDISIENAKGSKRSGISHNGVKWESTLPADYGYVRRTKGADGDAIDVYIGEHHDADRVYVIDQKHHRPGHATHGAFDEHKCMIGYPDIHSAMKAYRAAFSDKNDRVLACTVMTIPKFKQWLFKHEHQKPVLYFKGTRGGKRRRA